MVAEILAGLALVNSAVKSIKGAIGTAKDISEVADQIDNLFKGKEEVQQQAHPIVGKWNRLLTKTLGSSADRLSIGAIARETIEEKLAEEQILKVKRIINIRFGGSTWDNILEERRKRIIEHEKQLEEEQEEKDEFKRKLHKALEWTIGVLVVTGSIIAFIVYISWVKK
tara:strand:+ start:68 stop:574 length:507 start_codon:yes stop_codon:yes gene_type:complete